MFVLHQHTSIANHFLAELRGVEIQQDRLRFRKNLERLGTLLAYELSKELNFHKAAVTTPLGEAPTRLLKDFPVLVTIMRAGLPFYQGFLEIFDQADSAFIGAFRGVPKPDQSFDIEMGYCASPSLEGREIVLIDPMLATGKSLIKAYRTLVETHGQPAQTHIVAAVASEAGVAYIQDQVPKAKLWLGDIDPELDAQSYIVPGLGDAGDLAFGGKS